MARRAGGRARDGHAARCLVRGLLLAVPNALPGLTIPGTGSMPGMSQMSNTDDGPSERMPAKPMGRMGPKPAGADLGMSPMGP